MRYLRLLPLILTLAFIILLNNYWSEKLPALGRILDPINGAMAAAERTDKSYDLNARIKGLQAPVAIYLEDRLVPHIYAQNNHDLYLAQGFIHASFRLWQMDFQTRAAAGRISEVVGPKAIEYDRGQRRKGMVWGAEHSLKTLMAEPRTAEMVTAYTEGINAYIHSLDYRALPLEYKLIGYMPEDWTPLKTALMMKALADDLTGYTEDIPMTVLRDQLGDEDFNFLFPEKIKGSKPVIPEGTKFAPPSLKIPPAPGDSVWAHFISTPSAQALRWPAQNAPIAARLPPIAAFFPHSDGRNVHSYGMNARSDGRKPPGGGRSVRFDRNEAPAVAQLPRSGVQQASGGNTSAIFTNNSLGSDNTPQSAPEQEYPDGTGSNNWAISGAHTASGAPILCNDPHLALSLPSLWYEMQLTAPGINSYGVSLPGAPGIVIGFNDSISWGFTNNYRDVKDFYDITIDSIPSFRQPPPPTNDRSQKTQIPPNNDAVRGDTVQLVRQRKYYVFCNQSMPFDERVETIKIKGRADYVDTVLYTLHGPVMYDPTFPDPAKSGRYLACTWMGHRGSNELLAVWLLNRAGDYNTFTQAIQHFECPAQNIAYADRAGNIAMWGQGQFINKWKGQGRFVMEGKDSATLWGANIPMAENPHVLNPPQGYVASANQSVTDSTYPYWYNGYFFEFRAWEINEILGSSSTVYKDAAMKKPRVISFPKFAIMEDSFSCRGYDEPIPLTMPRVQNDVHSFLGSKMGELIRTNTDGRNRFFRKISGYDYRHFFLGSWDDAGTIFQVWWSQLYKDIWQDNFPHIPANRWPTEERTMQLLLTNSTSKWYDDVTTPQHETLRDIVQRAFAETTDSLNKLSSNAQHPTPQASNAAGIQREASNPLAWYNVKNTTVRHLARIAAFSFDHLKIGGWKNTINACTGDHGPSWRMIVEMGKDSIRAYGVYPGGQSGNPGSPHYADYLADWVAGDYNKVRFLSAATAKNPFRYAWTLRP